MKSINLIYFGSPAFSAQILEFLCKLKIENCKFQVVGVVTTPDKPTGRRLTLTSSPVALLAEKYHLPTFKPQKLDAANLTHLKLLQPDLFLVASYGKIIPQDWLNAPSLATLNLHFSLLPKYRGALCIQEAIKNQDSQTGVTLMVMDEEMDHGPVISQITQDIDIDDDVATLTSRLTSKAIELLQNVLPQYLNQQVTPQDQDHSQATYTPSYKTLTRDTAFIPWAQVKKALETKSSTLGTKLHALIRSLNPQPGAWTKIPTSKGELEAKITQTRLGQLDQLDISSIQLPGRNPISWKQFLTGNQVMW